VKGRLLTVVLSVVAGLQVSATVHASRPAALAAPQESSPRPSQLEQILDLYVRDGDVYYRALNLERARLDSFVARLATESIDKLSRDERLAFWLNAYNALVLRTVIDHYPMQVRSADYPQRSIRQIPGAFERLQHRVAGRTLTLDQIEQTILPEFHDPRVYLALGRAAAGSGRPRSEAYAAAKLETQLTEAANECVSHAQCYHIDGAADTVSVSSIFSWHEKEFVAAYANSAAALFASRAPIERAVIAFVQPKLLATEKEFLEKNTFRLAYTPFDWTLNDLTGRGGR
jgi:hypothetical protein